MPNNVKRRYFCTATVLLLLTIASTSAGAESGAGLFLGRWTILNDRQGLSDQQRPYKIIDVVPCEGHICGISVSDTGDCGSVLFRHLTLHEGPLGLFMDGSGKWGKDSLTLRIIRLEDAPQIRVFLSRFTVGTGNEGTRTVEYRETYRRMADAACSTT
ncbi:hypothetical protein [Bosea sp. 685]|uniref:hypothetical protein n=1 Tax=Bosea sp. 685 TaxID=3080057 RepID=UPI0028935718|nr:hypothetical protein [Bosea sp. 685]WNJ93368.1 hypothetical protein RMR04_14205 [Bosea sp. 685]